VARPKLSRFEWACAALVLLGLATRLLVFWYRAPQYDAEWYMTMGKTLLYEHEFTAPWLPQVAYTQHFPPAFPAILAVAFLVGGASFNTAAVASILVAAFLVAVTFLTTWDLYGRPRAFAVTAVVATFAAFINFDVQILSESLVAAFFALTVWGILKSLDDPRFIVVAGLFAGMGYLTKASMGPFFLLAGAGGFAWRFYYVRWRVFRDQWYLLAGCLFALFVVPWAARNVLRHGWPNWETQAHASDAISYFFFSRQVDWPLLLVETALWGAVILLSFALPFLPEIRASVKRIKEERTSALWLAVGTPTVIAIVFAAAFGAIEGRAVVREDTVRYLVTPVVPLVWLGMRELDLGEDAPRGKPDSGAPLVRRRATWLALGVAVTAFFLFANPVIPYTSFVRFFLLVVGTGVGFAFVLVSRSHAWKPVARQGKGASGWRAVAAEATGPNVLLALAAFAFAVAILVGVAYVFFAVLVPAAVSLAAGSTRARVLALACCTLVVPLAHYAPETSLIPITDALDHLAPPGATVKGWPGAEFYIYPELRPDLKMTSGDATDTRPFDYFVRYSDDESPIPGYHQVEQLRVDYRPGPGTAVSLWLWGHVLGDQDPVPTYVSAQLWAKNATAS
jgi:4-amino-4-deoxy-L-arabinose transferase-like glycosyltransferase